MSKAISNFYTENGGISAKTRDGLKAQVVAHLTGLVPTMEKGEKALRIPLGTNERGETVYAFVAITVSTKESVTKPKAKADVAAVELPNIFE